jgi:hypothetical protein
MKRLAIVISSISLLVAFLVSAAPIAAKAPKILTFDTMVGVPLTLTGVQSQVPLRGLNGGGVPWTIRSGRGFLSADGSLKIEVQGLVLAATDSNPVTTFRGLVSCVRSDGAFENLLTAAFPATTGLASAGGGNADIEAQVALPSPCIAPIVFVTSPGGSWFAATGH